jgi:hypothetical protein
MSSALPSDTCIGLFRQVGGVAHHIHLVVVVQEGVWRRQRVHIGEASLVVSPVQSKHRLVVVETASKEHPEGELHRAGETGRIQNIAARTQQ